MIRMYKIQNTKVLGRGVIDANGKAIRAQNDTKINLFKIEQSSNILIDGILVRDPELLEHADLPQRPGHDPELQGDQLPADDHDLQQHRRRQLRRIDQRQADATRSSTPGDDSMATKNEEPSGTINTKNIVHEKVVCYSNSVWLQGRHEDDGHRPSTASTFRDIDVVKAGRALNIDAYDTAVVQNTRYENIRIEAADTQHDRAQLGQPPDWRTAANTSVIKDTYFTNVASDVKKPINLHGKSATVNIAGVHFNNLTVAGQGGHQPDRRRRQLEHQ